MKKVLVVAAWEYLERVKSKAFIFGLFFTPVIMVGSMVVPALLTSEEDKDTKVLGIIDQTGKLALAFSERMEQKFRLPNGAPRYVVQPIAVGEGIDLESARLLGDEKVVQDELEGYCIVSSDSTAEYRSKNVGDLHVAGRIEQTLKGLITERRIAALGLDPSMVQQLSVSLDVKPVKLSKTGKEEKGGFLQVFFTAYVFLMMLFSLILSSGQSLVRSVLEEKSSRIVEVLISSCSPTELMGGKVLGLSALGLSQIGFWAIIGTAASLQFHTTMVPIEQALLLIMYFVLGYLFYAAVFIAFGSPVTTEQEAQHLTSYLVLFLVIPLVIAMPVMQNPNAGWIKVLTYIPLLTPTMMALRIPISMPSTLEIAATVLLLVASIIIGMWVAGRIFRIAILATGKRPSLRELARWVKTG